MDTPPPAIPPPRKVANSTKAILLMVASTGLLSTAHVGARWLTQEVHPFEAALFRNVAALLFITPLVMRHGRAAFRSNRPGMQAVRGIAGVATMLLWYMSLSVMPVAEATAISFSVVIFSTIAAIFFLGEKVGLRRWSAILVGFLGMLIIIRPGIANIGAGAWLVLASTCIWAMAIISTKILSRHDLSVVLVFYSSVYAVVLTAVPAALVWTTPTLPQLAVGLLMGVLASTSMILGTEAMKYADASVVMPVDFTRLIWAAAIGFIAFGEFPDLWSWIGGTVIFASTLYITLRESRARRAKAVTGPGPDPA